MTHVAIGLGLTSEATIDQVRTAIDQALASLALGWADVSTVATTVRRGEHPAVHELANDGAVVIQLFEPAELARVTVPNASAAVGERAGTASVAEAAALLAADADVLALPKQVGSGVTVAIANSAPASRTRT